MNLKVLHLASFDGNIGDNANHFGFYKSLRNIENFTFDITLLEIREFYWGIRRFDDHFVTLVNKYDLLIIGGGNYFELWVEDSPTGTSIAVELHDLVKIKTPIIFNALGVDYGQGASLNNLKKFTKFLDAVIERKDFISIRNDGAAKTISKFIGEKYLKDIVSCPDAGFLVEVNSADKYYTEKKIMAVNIVCDMPEVRFSGVEGNLNYSQFKNEFASVISKFLECNESFEVVFVPHIFSDLKIIYEIVELVPDSMRRRKVSVAPLMHGTESFKYVMGIYNQASLTLANRFHANVCSLGLGTPTIGLGNYLQIFELYNEISSTDIVDIRQSFKDNLFEKIASKIGKEKDFSVKNKMIELYDSYIDLLSKWMRNRYQ